MKKLMMQIKRIYDKPDKEDGFRILIDRLWARGLSKDKAKVDLWLKDIAPSNELRKWFSHDPSKWLEFKGRYKEELKNKSELIDKLKREAKKGKITLLFAARDIEHNNAVVLKEIIEHQR